MTACISLKTAILISILLFQLSERCFSQITVFERGNFTALTSLSQDAPEIIDNPCPGSGFGHDDKPDQYPGMDIDREVFYWLIPVLHYIIVIENDSLDIQPGSGHIIIAMAALAGLSWWNSEDAVLEQCHRNSVTPVGDPVFLFSAPMDGGGKGEQTQSKKSSGKKLGESQKSDSGLSGGRKSACDNQEKGEGGQHPEEQTNTSKNKPCYANPAEALNKAIRQQDIELVQVILSEGADPDRPWHGEKPVFAAIHPEYGNVEILIILLDSGASANSKQIFRMKSQGLDILEYLTPLEALMLLVESGGRVNYYSNYNKVDMTCWAGKSTGDVAPFIQALLEKGAQTLTRPLRIDSSDNLHKGLHKGMTVGECILSEAWNEFKYLRKLAMSPLGKYEKGWLLYRMTLSIKRYSPETFKWLIEEGADIDYCKKDNEVERISSTCPLGVLLDVISEEQAQFHAPYVHMLLSAGADCEEGCRNRSSLILILERYWDGYPQLRDRLFQSLLTKLKEEFDGVRKSRYWRRNKIYNRIERIDINTITINNDGSINVYGKGMAFLDYILMRSHHFSNNAIYFLFFHGLTPIMTSAIRSGVVYYKGCDRLFEYFSNPCVSDECLKQREAPPEALALKEEIEKFNGFYETYGLSYECLIVIIRSLSRVEDIEQLPIPERLKNILRSEPFVKLIGIGSPPQR